MTETDFEAFGVSFQQLRRVFPLRGEPDEIGQILRLYFKAMQRWPLDAVTAGAEAWTVKGARFPRPGDWISAIPHGMPAMEHPPLFEDEAREHRHAIDVGYQDDPCHCYLCCQAGITHRPVRYVPDEDDEGNNQRGMLDGRVVVRGHWAHGTQLRDWYSARDKFHALLKRAPKGMHVVKGNRVTVPPPPVQEPDEPNSDDDVAVLLSADVGDSGE